MGKKSITKRGGSHEKDRPVEPKKKSPTDGKISQKNVLLPASPACREGVEQALVIKKDQIERKGGSAMASENKKNATPPPGVEKKESGKEGRASRKSKQDTPRMECQQVDGGGLRPLWGK